MENSRKTANFTVKIVLWALPFILALSYVFTRQNLNVAYPKNDASLFVYTAQLLYDDYVTGGNKIDFQKIYNTRDFKKSAYPLLIFVNLIIFDGNSLKATNFISFTFWALFLVYTLLICRNFIGSVFGLLTFYLIVTFPSFLSSAFTGTLELPLLFCISGITYHYLQSNKLANIGHVVAIGLLISLGIILRPTELFVVLVGMYSYFIYKHRLVSPFLVLLYVVLAATKFNSNLPLMTFAGVLLPILMFAELYYKKILKFSAVFLLPYFVLVGWYYTSFEAIWYWIHFNNFTDASAETGRRIGLSLFEFWISLYLRWGANTMFLLTIAGLFVLLFSKTKKIFINFLIYCIPLLTLVFFGSFTNNGDPRYYYIGLFICFVGFGIFFEKASISFTKYILLIAIALQMTFNYLEITNSSFGDMRNLVFSVIRPKKYWPYEPIIFYSETYEPLPNIVSELRRHLPQNKKLRILSVAVQQRQTMQYLFESVGVAVVAKDYNQLHNFFPTFSTQSTKKEVLKKHFDYILLGPLNLTPAEKQNDLVQTILTENNMSLPELKADPNIVILAADYKGFIFKYSLIKLNE